MVNQIGAYARIQWLHSQLMNNQFPNAKKLATHFEISQRQAQRDIEYMRDSLGAPMQYLFDKKGYCYADSFVLPTYFIDEKDRVILDIISNHYEGLFEMGFKHYQEYFNLLKRLRGTESVKLDTEKTSPLAPFIATIEFLDGRSNFRLIEKFCIKELSDRIKVYEFTHTELFLGLLFACGTQFRVISPGWLRERIVQISEKIGRCNQSS